MQFSEKTQEGVSDETLLQFLNEMGTGLLLMDLDSRCLYLNPSAEKLTGYSLIEAQGKLIQEILTPSVPSSGVSLISEYLLNNNNSVNNTVNDKNHRFQSAFINKNGQIYDAVCDTKPFYQNGVISGSFLELQDITEQKKLETELKESETKFRRVYESDMIGILYWTTTGAITDANDAFLRMVGYTRAEMLNGQLRWRDITPQQYASLDDMAYDRLLAGETVVPYEKQYIHKDGHLIDILIRSAFLEKRTDLGLACILDITEQKASEKALQESSETLQKYASKLTQSNKELEHFATIASHDLQEPLRKVLIFGDHLRTISEESLNEEARDDLLRMQKATQRMQSLISDLLDLSRVTRRGNPFRKMSLESVFREVLADLSYKIKLTGSKIEADIPHTIEADEKQIHQMLFQLLDNAMTFHRENVPAIVSVSSKMIDPEHCQITVEDNGMGIKAENIDRIFDIFVRLNREKDYPGTGIGLALVKKIVERHEGSLDVVSMPDQGSKFIITLPVKH